MSSDTARPAPDAPWRPAGTGMSMTIICDTCRKAKSQYGAKLFRAMWRCAYCRNELLQKESMDQPA